MSEEPSPEEHRLVALELLSEGSAGRFVWEFMTAMYEGRFADARAHLDVDSALDPSSVGDPMAQWPTFVIRPGWGFLGMAEITPDGDEVVTFVPEGQGDEHGILAPYSETKAVQFVVRRRDGAWGILRIIRRGA